MSFVPIAELLKKDTYYLQSKALNTVDKCETLKSFYKKNKDPKIKNLIKRYENEAKEDIKNYERSDKLAKKTYKELIEMKNKNRELVD